MKDIEILKKYGFTKTQASDIIAMEPSMRTETEVKFLAELIASDNA